jgi:Ca2+-binding EF-hand superfamily protein
MDDDNSRNLDFTEFSKAVRDYRVGIDQATTKLVFDGFDRDKQGTIDYEEFLRGVVGTMNPFRLKLVEQAFQKLDKDGSGVIELNDLKGVYDAKNHPDVKGGKRTEEEILGEFLETFEMHHNIGGGTRDQKITKEEFTEYYNNVSASIDNDQYFELMMVTAWKLQGSTDKRPGWKAEYGGGKGSPGRQAPYGTSETPMDYTTSSRVHGKGPQEELKAGAAGRPTTSPSPAKVTAASTQAIETFRQTLKSRGIRGIFGLQRTFKVALEDAQHCVDNRRRQQPLPVFGRVQEGAQGLPSEAIRTRRREAVPAL